MMIVGRLTCPLVELLEEFVIKFRIKRAISERKKLETRSGENTRDYWRAPDDGHNSAMSYVETPAGQSRSQRLVKIMRFLVPTDAKILEIGCNAGRNLNYLYQAGFRNLSAVEISPEAIRTMSEVYPETHNATTIYNSPIEEVILTFADGQFDVVYSVAVLQHIHPESEWIFGHIARVAKQHVVTMEVEDYASWRHFPRSYKEVFEGLGMRQLRRFKGARIFAKRKS